MKKYLLKMIELYCYKKDGRDVWHDGRFIDRWADDWILDRLKGCFAHYEKDDIGKAHISTHELFKELAAGVANVNGYEYPKKAENTASEFLERL